MEYEINNPVEAIRASGPNFIGFQTHFSLPKAEIPKLVKEYIKALELGNTEEWCKCEWLMHPDDVDIPVFCCRNCKHHMTKHQDRDTRDDSNNFLEVPCSECGCNNLQTRRLRLKEQHNECPVHTREGLILGFYEWAFHE